MKQKRIIKFYPIDEIDNSDKSSNLITFVVEATTICINLKQTIANFKLLLPFQVHIS